LLLVGQAAQFGLIVHARSTEESLSLELQILNASQAMFDLAAIIAILSPQGDSPFDQPTLLRHQVQHVPQLFLRVIGGQFQAGFLEQLQDALRERVEAVVRGPLSLASWRQFASGCRPAFHFRPP
jgi:hypothetical protein